MAAIAMVLTVFNACTKDEIDLSLGKSEQQQARPSLGDTFLQIKNRV